ncbi:MAG: SUMF1/EgtB/PvdO family nonheme iron enzyme [Chromatiaceae bacterium]|jgi:serine/threonine-protein kinase PpkA|nr:SUMF1/EgtB/PvdO family nonheme iron enzyme [Chromatiaceae bacterium]
MQIPGYTIIRELGRGGMATVYLAKQDRLGRQVALKVMQPQAVADDDFTTRFIKEGQIIAQLQHPQIVTIYDFNIADGLHYFSMEYLPNGTLADQIARGLSLEQAIDITRRVAQALSVAHDQGVIHRDIKPQNILFRADGTPVLTDFGIARAVRAGADATQLTHFGMVIGSPRYMSPEQSMSQPTDARSDLYSLGVVFYEMLTREAPYQADDVISLAMKHCSAPLPVLPEPLAAFQPILDRLLAKKPEDRFGSAQELIRALDVLAGGRKPIALPEEDATRIVARDQPKRPAPEPRPPLARGHGVRSALLALAAVLVVAIGVYLALPERPEDPIPGLPPADPDRSATIERYENLAIEHFGRGEFKDALKLVELALGSRPGDLRLGALKQRVIRRIEADDRLREAEQRRADGQLVESLALIEQGLERDPEHQALTALRAQVLQERKAQTETRVEQLLGQARTALDQGSLAEAMRLTHDGLALIPGDARLKELEATAQRRLEQQRALRDVIAQASSLLAEGLLQESLKLIEKGLATDPDDAELRDLRDTVSKQIARDTEQQVAELRTRAQRSADQGAFPDALAAIDQALRLRPADPELQELRGEVAARSVQAEAEALFDAAKAAYGAQDLDEALRLAEEGLGAMPEHVGLFAFRAMLQAQVAQREAITAAIVKARGLLRANRLGESLETITGALQLAPDSADLLGLRAEVLSAQQQRLEDQVGELLQHARQLFGAGNLDAALALTDKAQQLAPRQPAVGELREEILAQQGHAARLQQQLQDCAAELPSEPSARASALVGALDSAAACYRRVLDLDANNPKAQAKLAEIRQRLSEAFARALDSAAMQAAEQALAALEALDPDDPQIPEMRTALRARAELLPEMVTIKGDCFEMGSPESEPDRETDERAHRACVEDFELAKHETRVADFRRFVDAEGYQTDAERGTGGLLGCWALDEDKGEDAWGYHPWANWATPNKYQQTDPSHPVVCVSWNDAQAYLRWLTRTTRSTFRLPTEAEWEFAARAGTPTARFWGNGSDTLACRHANVADTGQQWAEGFPCDDGHEWAAPVGSYAPNPWGLHDLLGNVMEWTCSEYDAAYRGVQAQCAPPDATAPMVLRGGAWNSGPAAVRSAYRNRNYPESRYNFVGFRVARDPTPED